MKEKIEMFYLRKGTLIFFEIAAMLGWLSWSVSTFATGDSIKLTIFGVIFFLLTLGLTIAYLKGETNIQKMLFGSLLLFLVIDYIEIVVMFFSYNVFVTGIVNAITLVVLIVFYICHILQQLDHVGNAAIIVVNQCCGFVIVLTVVYFTITLLNGAVEISDYTFCAAIMFTMCLVICMETRIGRYKQIRNEHRKNGDWNEATRAEAKKLFKISK